MRSLLPGSLEYQRHYGFFCFIRHLRNGAAIARCSQPEISWWGWRNADDEYLVTSIAKACALDPGTRTSGASLSTGTSDASEACDTDFGKAWVVPVPPVIGPLLASEALPYGRWRSEEPERRFLSSELEYPKTSIPWHD